MRVPLFISSLLNRNFEFLIFTWGALPSPRRSSFLIINSHFLKSLGISRHSQFNRLVVLLRFSMGKPTGKKKNEGPPPSPRHTASTPRGSAIERSKTIVASSNRPNTTERSKSSAAAFDEDTAIFITLAQELKEEGNKLFQKRDHEGAMLKYEKALKLLPKTHIDVAYLRSNMAACYMQMGLGEYPRAINECNLALEVSPKYSKALLKRAKCYEALNKLDLAWRDVDVVLAMEPNNLTALDVLESIKKAMENNGIPLDEKFISMATAQENVSKVPILKRVVREKIKKKKKNGKEKEKEKEKVIAEVKEKEVVVDSVMEENSEARLVSKRVKLILGEDIRIARLPANCDVGELIDTIRGRFSGLKGVLAKYKDPEGDLVTITSTSELRLAESSAVNHGSLRIYIAEVGIDQEPAYEAKSKVVEKDETVMKPAAEVGEQHATCVDDWIVQFARLFKNHVGFDSDSYLDLHELGMKLYSEAMEDVVSSDDAQEIFDIAADKFQEMAALALFNWGNVHLSKARKRAFLPEDGSKESLLAQLMAAYEWSKKEYSYAGLKYQEAVKIKPDFYEGLLALGQQHFEQAKLCWYNAIGRRMHLESGSSEEVLDLYNKAEDYMEKGMQMWEESEEQRLNGLSKFENYKTGLQKAGLDGLLKELPAAEAAELAANMSSQIYLLWGTILYERSLVEYKLELPTWEECLEVSVEKFELAGASPTDIAVMLKNHSSNDTALEGIGFKIDEIVQAWNEMYDAKRWETGIPSFRLEPLFRRRAPKLHSILELAAGV